MAEYDYAAATGYARARSDWESWPSRNTVVRRGDVNRWDQAIYDLKHTVYNAKDYGAVGDGVTDDYTAIVAAYTAIPSTGGTLYFPPGTYKFGTALSFTNAKPVALVGAGAGASTLKASFASGDAVTFNGPTTVICRGLSLAASVTRSAASYYLKIVSATTCDVDDVVAFASAAGAGLYLSGCNSPRVSNVRFAATDGTQLRLASTGGAAITNSFFSQGASEGSAPTVYVTGTATSNTFTGCHFGGGGPALSYSISGITSTGANFTVTTSATHTLQPNDFVCIRGASVAAYNNQWRIASVTATTIVVTSTLNPGSATATGTAESVTACFYADNSSGSVNESMISTCIFETGGGPSYGSASAVFNGRAQTDGAGNTSISGWTISGCYVDYGQTGILLASQDVNASHQSSVYGFTIGDCVFATKMRPVHLDRPQGVFVTNCTMNWPSTYTSDGVSETCGLYVWAGPTPKAQATGITVQGCNLGWPRDFGLFGETFATYGVILDGAGINDLIITGNHIAGGTAAFQMANTPVAAAQRWKIKNNILGSGTLPLSNTTVLPSVASAATVDLTAYPFDAVKITGTTNISTISGGWLGRDIKLLFASDLTLLTGGNLAIAANRHVRAGELVDVAFDGSTWCVAGDPTASPDQLAAASFGLKAWTYSPMGGSNATGALTSQKLFFTAIPLRAGDVVTNIWASVVVAAAGTTPTTIKLGLFNSDGSSRLAVTANLASDAKWTSVGFKSFAVSSPYTVTTSGIYLVAVLKDGTFGTTEVQLQIPAGNSTPGSLNSVFPFGTGGTGLADIGTSITPASSNPPMWFGVS